MIREVLGTEGFDVKPVPDAGAALVALREEGAVFLVSDLSSAGGDGTDPLAAIDGEFPDLPVIVIQDQRAGDIPFFGPWRAEGSKLLLRRPFRLDDLIAASRELLS